MYRKALQIILLLSPALNVCAMQVEINRDGHREIRGEVVRHENGFLYIATDAYQTIGIPVEKISRLAMLQTTDSGNHAEDMLQFREILHLWDIPMQMKLIAHTESLAERQAWNACFQSASCIESYSREPSVVRMATELKALALFGMGLYPQCAEVLDQSDNASNHLTASTRVCWIMAKLAMRRGEQEQAIAWALIPKLRIPIDDTGLADQLYSDCQQWLNSK